MLGSYRKVTLRLRIVSIRVIFVVFFVTVVVVTSTVCYCIVRVCFDRIASIVISVIRIALRRHGISSNIFAVSPPLYRPSSVDSVSRNSHCFLIAVLLLHSECNLCFHVTYIALVYFSVSHSHFIRSPSTRLVFHGLPSLILLLIHSQTRSIHTNPNSTGKFHFVLHCLCLYITKHSLWRHGCQSVVLVMCVFVCFFMFAFSLM